MNDVKRKELYELLMRQTEGDLDDDAKQILAKLLRNDSEAIYAYVEHCQIHTMLAWEHGVLPDSRFDEQSRRSDRSLVVSRKSSRANHWKILALAASILLLFSTGWVLWVQRSNRSTPIESFPSDWASREVVARLTKSLGARLSIDGSKRELQVGDPMRTGAYSVVDGFVEFKFHNGSEVIVEAPASFQISNTSRMSLRNGHLSARVPNSGIGFTVETPSAHVVDFGTEFAIEVGEDQTNEVHVFAGEVEVRPKSSTEPISASNELPRAIRLVSNQATRFSSSTSSPEGIDVDLDRFVRDLDEPTLPTNRAVRGFKPHSYFRMASSDDGKLLINKGKSRTSAQVHRGKMIRPPFAPGHSGVALRLDGPDSQAYALLPKFEPVKDGNLTVVAWVRAESRPRWASIAKNWSNESIGQFRLGLFDDKGDLEIQVRDFDGNAVYVREHQPFPLSEWQHVAFVVDDKSLTLYRNGAFVGSADCKGLTRTASTSLGIGVKLNDEGTGPALTDSGFWHGRIDELAILYQSLSAEQIRELFESK